MSLSLILSLSFPRVHLARFQNITKKKRTNLLPILPSVHLHRLTQQLILRAANERLSVTPPAFTHESRVTQSINHAFTRSIHARVIPPPVLPFPLASVASSRGISKFQMRTSSGVHPPLALFRVGPPIFPSANARAVVVVAVPFADAACDRARAPACPRLFPVVPPRPRLFVAVAPFSSPPSLSAFATSRARTRDDTGRREDVRRPPRAMMTRARVARRPRRSSSSSRR